jgi:hypothetical protein
MGRSLSYEGQVEHLVSGQVGRFHSLEELLAFMTRVLTEVQEQSGSQWARPGQPLAYGKAGDRG